MHDALSSSSSSSSQQTEIRISVLNPYFPSYVTSVIHQSHLPLGAPPVSVNVEGETHADAQLLLRGKSRVHARVEPSASQPVSQRMGGWLNGWIEWTNEVPLTRVEKPPTGGDAQKRAAQSGKPSIDADVNVSARGGNKVLEKVLP
jgi:hypothetical protein